MQNILVVGCHDEQIKSIHNLLHPQYHIETANSLQETIAFLSSKQSVLVLLNIDDPSFDTMNVLEILNINTKHPAFPCVIITHNENECPLDIAFQKGAVDYITYSMKPVLAEHRIKSILNHFKEYTSTLSANSIYLFYNAIGPAMLVHINGEIIDVLMVNEDYYQVVGCTPELFEEYRHNLINMAIADERPGILHAICNAKKNKSAKCITSNVDNGRFFQNTYRYIQSDSTGDLFLIMMDDITQQVQSDHTQKAMLRLPGSIVFEYECATDQITFFISEKNRSFEIQTDHTLENDKLYSWLAPQHGRNFRSEFRKMKNGTSDNAKHIDIQASFGSSFFSWHRMYFQPVFNNANQVLRIIGRVDNLEGSSWTGVRDKNRGLCDVETHLLTYHAFHSYMKPFIEKSYNGTLYLVDVDGLSSICQSLKTRIPAGMDQRLLKHLAHDIKVFFNEENIVGRYSTESFLIFLPQSLDESKAFDSGNTLIHILKDRIQSYEPEEDFRINIGISIAGRNQILRNDMLLSHETELQTKSISPDTIPDNCSIDFMFSEANRALLDAQDKGDYYCIIAN